MAACTTGKKLLKDCKHTPGLADAVWVTRLEGNGDTRGACQENKKKKKRRSEWSKADINLTLNAYLTCTTPPLPISALCKLMLHKSAQLQGSLFWQDSTMDSLSGAGAPDRRRQESLQGHRGAEPRNVWAEWRLFQRLWSLARSCCSTPAKRPEELCLSAQSEDTERTSRVPFPLWREHFTVALLNCRQRNHCGYVSGLWCILKTKLMHSS